MFSSPLISQYQSIWISIPSNWFEFKAFDSKTTSAFDLDSINKHQSKLGCLKFSFNHRNTNCRFQDIQFQTTVKFDSNPNTTLVKIVSKYNDFQPLTTNFSKFFQFEQQTSSWIYVRLLMDSNQVQLQSKSKLFPHSSKTHSISPSFYLQFDLTNCKSKSTFIDDRYYLKSISNILNQVSIQAILQYSNTNSKQQSNFDFHTSHASDFEQCNQ